MARNKKDKITKEIIQSRIRNLESQLLHLKLDLDEYFAEEETRVAHQRVINTVTQGEETTEEQIVEKDQVVVLNPNPGQPTEGEVVRYNPDSGFAWVKGEGGTIRRYLKFLKKKTSRN